MARDGKMEFIKFGVLADENILSRSKYEAVAITLDFGEDAGYLTDANGDVYIPAGTPIDDGGVPVVESPWTDAVGILLNDVYASRPQGTVLIKAYIDTTKAIEHSNIEYDASLAVAFSGRIVFENPTLPPESNLVGVGLVGSMIVA